MKYSIYSITVFFIICAFSSCTKCEYSGRDFEDSFTSPEIYSITHDLRRDTIPIGDSIHILVKMPISEYTMGCSSLPDVHINFLLAGSGVYQENSLEIYDASGNVVRPTADNTYNLILLGALVNKDTLYAEYTLVPIVRQYYVLTVGFIAINNSGKCAGEYNKCLGTQLMSIPFFDGMAYERYSDNDSIIEYKNGLPYTDNFYFYTN